MYVIKVEVLDGKVIETVVARDLPAPIAKARALALNDARDTGAEDAASHEAAAMVSYVARNL